MPNELTNPNNVVTEERLAQFYQQILPYLGGMPDVLANKFNRADLYSTDEKLIGRWIDGKPLYEKVIIQTDYNINSSWKYVSTGIVNLGEVVELKGTFAKSESGTDIYSLSYGGGDAFISLAIDKSNDKIAIKSGESRTGKLIVVIKYTKTTDSAVEIGDDTDYSTTEKIVGTWIDGKPIWQKSFDITETTIHNANAFEITLLSNVDSMISQNFMFMDEGLPNGKPIPKACWVAQDGYTHEASGYWYASYFYINPTTHDLKMRRDGNSGILHMYGTILYTKTSS